MGTISKILYTKNRVLNVVYNREIFHIKKEQAIFKTLI